MITSRSRPGTRADTLPAVHTTSSLRGSSACRSLTSCRTWRTSCAMSAEIVNEGLLSQAIGHDLAGAARIPRLRETSVLLGGHVRCRRHRSTNGYQLSTRTTPLRSNAAIAAGRMDLVHDLADECQEEALEMILEAEGASGRNNRAVEVLEAGGWRRLRGPHTRGRWRRR